MKSLLLSVAYGAKSLDISSRGCRFAATFPIVSKWLLPIMPPFPRTHAINQLIAPLVWLFGLFRPWRPAALTVTSYVNSSAPDCGPIPHISLRLSVFPFLNQWELPDCSVPLRKRYSRRTLDPFPLESQNLLYSARASKYCSFCSKPIACTIVTTLVWAHPSIFCSKAIPTRTNAFRPWIFQASISRI